MTSRVDEFQHGGAVDDSQPLPFGPAGRLERFRATSRRQRLHPLEKILLSLVLAQLVFLPWALGGMRWWAQLTSLVLALVTFAVALMPRTYTAEFTTGPDFRMLPLPRLLKFPVFWCGLLLLGYIVVQALNPGWIYIERDRLWWMEMLPRIDWLPSGTANPFVLGGPWRMLVIYGAAWLLVCSIWIGLTRRRSLQLLLTGLAANGFALALFALVQRLTSNGKIYWSIPSANASFFGSFIYKNHAGAYLLLILIVATALAAWHYLRGLRRMEKSSPSALFVFFAVLLATNIVVSYARGATLAMAAFVLAAGLAFLVFQWRQPSDLRRPLVSIALIAALGGFGYVGFSALSAEKALDRMQRLFEDENASVRSRQIASRATWEMLQDNWQWGTGAGSFRFLFPIYQQKHPEIFQQGKRRLFWDHAHNDLLQIPVELGLPGVALIVIAGLFWFLRLIKTCFWENPLAVLLVTGLLIVLAHAWTDFLFYNPAILLTWCALWPVVTLWAEAEEKTVRT